MSDSTAIVKPVIERDSGGKFKPGVVTNPNGRPRGSYSEATTMFMELRNTASKSWLVVWNNWMECIEEKERWAIELYVEKFTKKNDGEQRVFVGDITATNMEEMGNALLNKIPQFGMLTLTEILECYKAVNAVREKEAAAIESSNKVSHEALVDRLAVLNKAIELKDKSDIM